MQRLSKSVKYTDLDNLNCTQKNARSAGILPLAVDKFKKGYDVFDI